MSEQQKIEMYNTKFRYIGENEDIKFYDTWIITDTVHNLKNEFFFIMNPLQMIDGREGWTGLHCYIFTDEELKENFKIIREVKKK